METQTCSAFGARIGVTAERVRQMCKSGRIEGAKRVTLGGVAVWLIPGDAANPRMPPGRPKKTSNVMPPGQAREQHSPRFQRISEDPAGAAKRFREGRIEADRIIAAMREKGVKVELIGSMKTGKVGPNSDVDLLITDSGPMSPARALYEIDLLEGAIPLDVIVLEFVPQSSLDRVLESVHG